MGGRCSTVERKLLVEIPRPGRWLVFGGLFGLFERLLEFLFQKPVSVLERGHLALEGFLGLDLLTFEVTQKRVKIFAARYGLLFVAVGQYLPGRRVQDQPGFTRGAVSDELPGLGHRIDSNAYRDLGFGSDGAMTLVFFAGKKLQGKS